MSQQREAIDTYLLRVLHTLLMERSVTRAAVKLNQSQPAISAGPEKQVRPAQQFAFERAQPYLVDRFAIVAQHGARTIAFRRADAGQLFQRKINRIEREHT